jgi:membrane protein
MLDYFKVRIGWWELLKRTFREILADDAQGLASQLAYYFFLSLFPALLFLIALASLFPLQNVTDDIVRTLRPFAPQAAIEIIANQMLQIANGNDTGLLSIGLLGAIWSSSSAMAAVVNAMNKAYDIDESRSWWKVRLMAVVLTIGLAVFILVSFTLVVAGPEIADGLARHLGLSAAFVWTWKILQWPVVLFLVSLGIGLIYYFAPDAEQDWVWVTPGSLVATLLWLAGSLGFRYYAINFGHYEATYGAIGGIVLLLLWFYLSGLVIVIGAEMNAEIEHSSPWGKAPGEKVVGAKKRIGVAAARAFHESPGKAPDVPAPLAPPPLAAPSSILARAASVLALLLHWRRRYRHGVRS